jgi:hypothetical protein
MPEHGLAVENRIDEQYRNASDLYTFSWNGG